MNYKELAEKLVKKSLSMGANSAEVYIESGRRLSVSVRNSEVETIQEAASQGVGFRVFVDGRMGFSHCNDFSDKALTDTIGRAVAFARLSTPDQNNVLPSDKGITPVKDLYDDSVRGIAMEKKIAMAVELEKTALSKRGISKSSGAGYGETETEVFIANSNGLSKSYKASGCSLGISVVAEKDDQKNSGGEYSSRIFFADIPQLDEIASKAAEKALRLIDPVMIKTQRAAVIIDPDTARSLLGGIITAINGERVMQGASFLKDYQGKKFASELLTLTDDGTLPGKMSSSPFDGEGVPVRRNVIVENGILKSFIYNTKAAKRAGVESTGNASRSGFSSLPAISTNNVIVSAGKSSRDDIIRSTERGLLLLEVTGYGIDAVSGNFSGGASGLWIENGSILHPVRGVTIAGRAFDILGAIDMMGNDLDLNRSNPSPTFRVADIQIGGK